jgi:hypothetical protein
MVDNQTCQSCCPPCSDGEHAGDMNIPGTCDCCGYPLIQDYDAREMGFYEEGPLCGNCEEKR